MKATSRHGRVAATLAALALMTTQSALAHRLCAPDDADTVIHGTANDERLTFSEAVDWGQLDGGAAELIVGDAGGGWLYWNLTATGELEADDPALTSTRLDMPAPVTSAATGDVNGDGFADLVLGTSTGGATNQAVRVFLGPLDASIATLTVADEDVRMDPSTGGACIDTDLAADGNLIVADVGSADVAVLDGIADVVVGDQRAHAPGDHSIGEAYVVFGTSAWAPGGGTVVDLTSCGTNGVLRIRGVNGVGPSECLRPGDRAGAAIAVADVDLPGADAPIDLLVSATNEPMMVGSGFGRVHLFEGPFMEGCTTTASSDLQIEYDSAAASNGGFGSALTVHDGSVQRVVVSDPSRSAPGSRFSAGVVTAFDSGSLTRGAVNATPDAEVLGSSERRNLGRALATAELDGSGSTRELVITAPSTSLPDEEGLVWVLCDLPPGVTDLADPQPADTTRIVGPGLAPSFPPGERSEFGRGIAGTPDGTSLEPGIAVAAWGDDGLGDDLTDAGAAYLFTTASPCLHCNEPPTGSIAEEPMGCPSTAGRYETTLTATVSDSDAVDNPAATTLVVEWRVAASDTDCLAANPVFSAPNALVTHFAFDVAGCGDTCEVELKVEDCRHEDEAAPCDAPTVETFVVTYGEENDPTLSPGPADATVGCDAVPAPPTLTATDDCDPTPVVSFDETRTDGPCPQTYTLTRTWTATDECGNTDQHLQVLDVQDTTPPEASEEESVIACLWPPNHQYVCFDFSELPVSGVDNCSASPSVTVTRCESNQPVDGIGIGDGSTIDDCTIDASTETFCVRSERAGTDPLGRTYAIFGTVADECGNEAEIPLGLVHVPHDRRGQLRPTCISPND